MDSRSDDSTSDADATIEKRASAQPQDRDLTRRRALGLGARAFGVAGLASLKLKMPGAGMAMSRLLHPTLGPVPASAPLDNAYAFLDEMMDLYATGSTTRLVQSYVPTTALNLGDTGFLYDNALVTIALLQRGQSDDLRRANVLGRSLVYGQTHDPIGDGRLRDAYHTHPYVLPSGAVNIANGSGGSDTGNMAWAALALVHLYHKTTTGSYLNAAVKLGNWIQRHAYDTRGAGGYIGGLTETQQKLTYKATEHNIDLYALFTLLASATGGAVWTQRAQHALTFLKSIWNASKGFFWTGTGTDGVTINMDFIPEDVQSWSYLALADATYAASIDWAYANLAAVDGIFSGVSFSNADTSGVWFEGTGHMAAALQARNAPGDASKAATYLQDIELGQAQAPNTDGEGIDAASKDFLHTGDGCDYFAALHIGATSWYCIAKQAGNPFHF